MHSFVFFFIFSFLWADPPSTNIFHENEGCPMNSQCSKSMGIKKGKWNTALKGSFQKRKSVFKSQGLPIPLWKTHTKEVNSNLILWDSPCQHHRTPEALIYEIAEVFLKDLKEKTLHDLDSTLVSRPLWVILPEKIEKFSSLIRSNPIYLEKDSLYFLRHEEGYYYDISIDLNKKISLRNSSFRPPEFPKEIACDLEIMKKLAKNISHRKIYSEFYCQSIWHKDLKKYVQIYIPHSCS